jgi:hypothetical protein
VFVFVCVCGAHIGVVSEVDLVKSMDARLQVRVIARVEPVLHAEGHYQLACMCKRFCELYDVDNVCVLVACLCAHV